MGRRRWARTRWWRITRRSAVLWWALAIALAVTTASVVTSAVGRTTRAAAAWGTARTVWVVQRDVRAGEVIGGDDVARTRRPKGVVPDGALDGTASPVGEATRVEVFAGEVVLTSRLAGRGAHGLAAIVPPGRRAIALKNDETMPVVRAGDHVDVLATFDVGGGYDAESTTAVAPSFAVAADAEVLVVSARAITIAVSNREAPRVAFALARAAVTLALRSGANAPPRSR